MKSLARRLGTGDWPLRSGSSGLSSANLLAWKAHSSRAPNQNSAQPNRLVMARALLPRTLSVGTGLGVRRRAPPRQRGCEQQPAQDGQKHTGDHANPLQQKVDPTLGGPAWTVTRRRIGPPPSGQREWPVSGSPRRGGVREPADCRLRRLPDRGLLPSGPEEK